MQLIAFRTLIKKPVNPFDVVIMMRINIFKILADIIVLLTAHIFFAINIYKSWKQKDEDKENPGLLDEFETE